MSFHYEDHYKRNFCIIISICLFCIIIIHFIVFQPEYDKIANDEKTAVIKSSSEYKKITSMDCKELGNWLLLDRFENKTNLFWAQNHYLVNCK